MDAENVKMDRVPNVPGIGVTAAALLERLKTGKPGDRITDEELLDVAKKDCSPQGKGYGSLQTAIKRCVKDHGIVWRRQREAGVLECLKPEQVDQLVTSRQRHICRTSKRAVREINTVKLDDLPEKSRAGFAAKAAMLGTVAAFSSEGAKKKLEARNIQKPIDMKHLLESMGHGTDS